MDHGPIEQEFHNLMNALAVGIDGILNIEGEEKTVAFVLLTAKFGEIENGRVNYISNGERSSIVKMMKELLERFEGTGQNG